MSRMTKDRQSASNLANNQILTQRNEEGMEEMVHHMSESEGPDIEGAQVDIELPSRSSNNPNPKRRGPSRGLKLSTLEPGKKWKVEFDDSNQAIGERATDFVRHLGEIARNRTLCPAQVKEFKDINANYVSRMWDNVLEKFQFSVTEDRKETIIRKINDLFKDHRHKLKKKYFDTKTTYAERIRNRPKNKPVADWKYLVDMWSTTEFQSISTRNKNNRQKQKMPHFSGTKSHARLREEYKKEHNMEPSRIDILMEARKRKTKDGVPQDVGPTNAEAIAKLGELKKQRIEGLHDMNDDDMFAAVLGPEKRGYVRAYGPGKTISDYFGKKSSRARLTNQLEGEINELKKIMEEKDKKWEERAKMWEGREKMLEEREKMREEKMERLIQQLQRSHDEFGGGGSLPRDDDCDTFLMDTTNAGRPKLVNQSGVHGLRMSRSSLDRDDDCDTFLMDTTQAGRSNVVSQSCVHGLRTSRSSLDRDDDYDTFLMDATQVGRSKVVNQSSVHGLRMSRNSLDRDDDCDTFLMNTTQAGRSKVVNQNSVFHMNRSSTLARDDDCDSFQWNTTQDRTSKVINRNRVHASQMSGGALARNRDMDIFPKEVIQDERSNIVNQSSAQLKKSTPRKMMFVKPRGGNKC